MPDEVVTVSEHKRKRGRPTGTRKVVKNVTLDEDAAALLGEIADQFEVELGFKPTLSQTVRRLVHVKRKEGGDGRG